MATYDRHDPYHPGSRAVQDRVGVRELADHVGRSIGPGIRPVAAAFLELQPMLVVGGQDPASGRVWASLLTGAPGFVRATGAHQVSVAGAPAAGDPLAAALSRPGAPVGTIALDPRTRRRMRLNGRARPTPRGLAIEADQVFSNCPKYLQKRQLTEERRPGPPSSPHHSTELSPAQQDFIATADTFFIATVRDGGADASHRGGNPGFVTVTSPYELQWRDYPGNAMFLTLGNLTVDPRAGLLLLDWATGTTLQLTGSARTDYDASDGSRTVRFRLSEAVETPGASPWTWTGTEYSPANPPLAG
ncbi:pyridoxamine 5'-phosphate oxidase family protein [Streptomyces sp. NPDC059063]|uniref:pyridoxamine 5'-phosphate oxidase family protein n=1 Tax=unclassified Streptomyces TaxID=2593676 RepID=UPI00367FDA00